MFVFRGSRWKTAAGALLLISGLMLMGDPVDAPIGVLVVLTGTVGSWWRAWKAAAGTALRGALIWGGLAIALGILAQVAAWREPLEAGRPWSGRITYLMTLAILASLISVLNARNPGGGAWSILMVLLIVVFLIPWLEGAGRLRRAQGLALLQLDSPWTLFYGLLVLAGVTNFLPTRYGPAAALLGLGLVLESLGLTQTDWPASSRAGVWTAVAWTLGLSLWTARWCAERPVLGRNNLERLWFWFRDHWGVVWALRIQERFNRAAELARWPIQLNWFGLTPAGLRGSTGSGGLPDQAEATFRGLLRRFAVPERLEAALNARDRGSCHSEAAGR